MEHVVIIGNGIAGITAARHIRKHSNRRLTVISDESKHFFSRPALMYIYMGHMKYEQTKPYEDWFWKENAIDLVCDRVRKIDTKGKKAILRSGSSIPFDKLIIATGSKPNKFGWPGQDLNGVQGFYSLQDLEAVKKSTAGIRQAVIVGGGLIGVELAEMLVTRGIRVIFLVRETHFWGVVLPEEEGDLVARHIKNHHVDLQFESELKEIVGDSDGKVSAVITGKGEKVPCSFVGLTVGVSPNIDFIKNTAIETDRGVLINSCFETSIEDIYAIGDCAQFREPSTGRRPVEQVWYTGKMHGETVARTICGKETPYMPGIWFNSAKFFDIEYQTYGTVMSQQKEGEKSFYWENPKGDKCVRIVFDSTTQAVLGFNFFGIRARHTTCEYWIANREKLPNVLCSMAASNFDPEFFKCFEKDIISQYNSENPGRMITLKTKKGLFSNRLT